MEELTIRVDMPFGVAVPVTYQVQRLHLEPGDRLLVITDGMRERAAATVDVPALIQPPATSTP